MSETPAEYTAIPKKKRIALVDFDGVFYPYKGWKGPTVIESGPYNGTATAIRELRKIFTVWVFSTRASTLEGDAAIRAWLKKHNIVVDGITDKKIAAHVIIDDRAVCFRGNWGATLEAALDFAPYWEEKK